MTQAQILASPVDPATTALLLECLPVPPGASLVEIAQRRQTALEMAAELRPRDPVEAAMAVRVVAAHYGVMDSFRCAAQAELPGPLMIQHQGRAVALSRLMDTTLRALEQRQTRPALRPAAMPEVEAVRQAPPAPPTAEPARAGGSPPTPAARPAASKPAAAPPVAPPAVRVTTQPMKPDVALTAQQEQVLRDIARRAATSATALAA